MIIIDVNVPVIGKSYDFSIDENTKIETITEDVVDLIIQSEGFTVDENVDLRLFSPVDNRALPPDSTLGECGIDNADTLLLV